MIYSQVKKIAEEANHKVALTYNGIELKYGELIERVDTLSNYIQKSTSSVQNLVFGITATSPEMIVTSVLCADKLNADLSSISNENGINDIDFVLGDTPNRLFDNKTTQFVNLQEVLSTSCFVESKASVEKYDSFLTNDINIHGKGFENYYQWLIADLFSSIEGNEYGVEVGNGGFNELRMVLPLLINGSTVHIYDISQKQSTSRLENIACLQISISSLLDLASQKEFILPKSLILFSDYRFDQGIKALRENLECQSALEGIHHIHGYADTNFATSYRYITREQLPSVIESGIGKPIKKCGLLILDDDKNIASRGMAGQLFIAGLGVDANSKGERFMKDPFAATMQLFDTRCKARYQRDGGVQLVKSPANELLVDGIIVSLQYLENTLNSNENIAYGRIMQYEGQWYCFIALKSDQILNRSEVLERFNSSFDSAVLKAFIFIQVQDPSFKDTNEVSLETLKELLANDLIKEVAILENQHPEEIYHDITLRNNPTQNNNNKPRESQSDEAWEENSTPAIITGGELSDPLLSDNGLGTYLEETASKFPEHGIRLINNDEELFISYPELLSKAKKCCSGLSLKGIEPGSRAILQIKDQQDFFPVYWGCILRGVVPLVLGVPPLYDKSQGLARKINNAWNIMEKPVIISSGSLVSGLRDLQEEFSMDGLNVLNIDEILYSETDEKAIYKSQPDDLLFFLMTSGSTGMPKCIKVSHRGALSHIFGIKAHMQLSEQDVIVNMLPIDHITPLLSLHTRGVILSANQIHIDIGMFLDNPLTWFDTIDQYKGTHTFSPNFAYKLASERLETGEVDRTWDLSSIKSFKNGGELINGQVVEEFFSLTKDYGTKLSSFQPAYGMTEVAGAITLSVGSDLQNSTFHVRTNSLQQVNLSDNSDEESLTFVDVGDPIPGTSIRITNADNEPLNEYEIGSVQLNGAVVTKGYLNNPDAEKDVFLDEGWFKTGDLGFIAGGKLIITGREKDLLIYNGVNYYAYEIEYVINKIDEVESNYAAAVSYSEQNNTEGIAVFFTPKDESINNVKEVVRNVKRDLSQQLGLEPHLIIPLRNEDFPRTDSGKIDKPKLRSNLSQKVFGQLYDDLRMSEENSLFDSTVYLTNVDLLDDLLAIKGIDNTNIKLGDQLPKNLSEKDSEVYQTYDLSQRKNSERLSLYELEMKDIWSKILQKDSINVNQSFFELGGNSLRAIQIVTRINESLNVDVDIKDLFNHPTVADLSKCLMEKSVSDTILIKPREEADHYELSHSQKMLWILDEQEDEHIAYNMFQAYTFKGNLNIDAFNKAFDLLIERHESLRTVFINVKGEPRQRVLENIDFSLEYTAKSLSQQDINELMAEEISKPFNLSEGPLLRGSLIKTDSDEFVFLFSMHHIISDGWSFEVIIKDIMDLYDSICLDLPLDNQLEIQYKDYSMWYNQLIKSDTIKPQRDYWLEKLSGDIATLNLIESKPRPDIKSYEGKVLSFSMTNEESEKVRLFTQANEITFFHFFVAVIKVVLFKYTKQNDITVGAPIAGRLNSQLENQIGFYLNNIVLRDVLSGEMSFVEFQKGIRKTILEAYSNDLYPFDLLVEDLEMVPDPGRNPLYDVMIVMDTNGISIDDNDNSVKDTTSFVDVDTIEPEYPISKLDLTFFVRKADESFDFDLEFRTDLFDDDLILRMIDDLKSLMDKILDNPHLSIEKLVEATYTKTEINEIQSFTGSVMEKLSSDF